MAAAPDGSATNPASAIAGGDPLQLAPGSQLIDPRLALIGGLLWEEHHAGSDPFPFTGTGLLTH